MGAAAAMALSAATAFGGPGSRMARSGKPIIDRLRKRPEFIRLRDGARYRCAAFLLQAKSRPGEAGNETPRFGFTVTKKTGNAVERNRIRRRLKEAVRRVEGEFLQPGVDYVLIGNRPALNETMDTLVAELTRGLAQVNRKAARPAGGDSGNGKRHATRRSTRRSQTGTSA